MSTMIFSDYAKYVNGTLTTCDIEKKNIENSKKFVKNNKEFVNFIVDDSQLKQGLYSPGMHIPIIGSSAIYKEKPDVMLILAWNFSKSIIKDHREYLRRGGTFVVPLPKVEIFQL